MTCDEQAMVTLALPGVKRAARWRARSIPVWLREDAVAEAALAVCRHIDRYRPTLGNFQEFANQVAKTAVLDFARRETGWRLKTRPVRVDSEILDVLAGGSDPHAVAVLKETLGRIAELDERRRICLLARTDKEAAETLGVSVQRAWQLRFDATRMLRA